MLGEGGQKTKNGEKNPLFFSTNGIFEFPRGFGGGPRGGPGRVWLGFPRKKGGQGGAGEKKGGKKKTNPKKGGPNRGPWGPGGGGGGRLGPWGLGFPVFFGAGEKK